MNGAPTVPDGARDPLGASTSAIAHHYDAPVEFFRLWLDDSLTYSCALWEGEEDTLADAQLRKIDYLGSLAGVRSGRDVLDVGCGWGGSLRRFVTHQEARHVVGLTLSPAQFRWARPMLPSAGRVHLESWEDHDATGAYDAIVCAGAIEHFARFGIGRRAAEARYRRFFDWCGAALRPDGRLALQTIVVGDAQLLPWALRASMFLVTEVFPESRLPRMAELERAWSGRFRVTEVRRDGDHYARTCRVWLEHLQVARAAATAVAGDPTMVETYETYLDAAARLFDAGAVDLLRVGLERTS